MSTTPVTPPAPKGRNTLLIGIIVALVLCVCVALVLAVGGGYMLTQTDILASATGTPTAAARPPVTSAPATKTASVISSITMATDTRGDNKDPVNPTTAFSSKAVFHAVVAIKDAPKNTRFTAAWYVTDVGSASSPNSLIDSTDLTADGTRNIDFTLSPNNQWPAGKYRVEISVNNVLDRVVDFTVTGSSSSTTPSAPAPKPSGFISGITMALDSKGENKDPVNPTTAFSPSAVFHAIVAVKNAPAKTVFSAAWYVDNVGSAAAPNTLIDTTDLTTDGTRNIDFTLSPNNKWPVGTYRVEVSVNGTLDTVVKFSVK